MEQNFLTYKGRPLVRSGNTIYYGSMQDKYVTLMHIESMKKQGDIEVADRIIVQLLATDESLSLKDRIANKGERHGLYEAIELADTWLTRYLKDEK